MIVVFRLVGFSFSSLCLVNSLMEGRFTGRREDSSSWEGNYCCRPLQLEWWCSWDQVIWWASMFLVSAWYFFVFFLLGQKHVCFWRPICWSSERFVAYMNVSYIHFITCSCIINRWMLHLLGMKLRSNILFYCDTLFLIASTVFVLQFLFGHSKWVSWRFFRMKLKKLVWIPIST